jgi:hypothetical protein
VVVPVTVKLPPTYTPFAIPTPPDTVNTPVVLELESVVTGMFTTPDGVIDTHAPVFGVPMPKLPVVPTHEFRPIIQLSPALLFGNEFVE